MIKTSIYILGHTGFIGSHLYHLFQLNTNYNVIGLSSDDCDLCSYDAVCHALSNIKSTDSIVFAATITRLKDNTYEAFQKNILMAEHIARFIQNQPISHLVFLSTVDVYGAPLQNQVITEQTPVNPMDYYAISKFSSEKLLEMTCQKADIPLSILRLAGVYGKGDVQKSTIWHLVHSAIHNKKIEINGQGSLVRDFVYVDDIYQICYMMILKKYQGILNIATGTSYSILDIATMIRKAYFPDIDIIFSNSTSTNRTYDLKFDVTQLLEIIEINNIKLTSLKNGLKKYLAHSKIRRKLLTK